MFDERILRDGAEPVRVNGLGVTHDFFDVMGVAPIMGRVISASDDTAGADPVVVLSHHLWTERLASDPNVIGRTIHIGRTITFTAIGVMPAGFDDGAVDYWIPLVRIIPPNFATRHVWVFRTAGDPAAIISEVRNEMHRIEPTLLVDNFATMDQRIEKSVSPHKLNLFLFGLFSGLALVLAIIGLYGVVAYSVGQRTQEFGIRMALGAQRSDVVRLVLTQGLRLALAGTAIGIGVALALSSVLRQLLFNVRPTDPITIASVVLLLTIVALVACWLPAFRASRIEPTQALRIE